MGQIVITLPDGAVRSVEQGTRIAEIAASISPRLAKSALAGLVDGRLVDLSHALDADASIRIVTPDSPEALDLYRHSTAHLMAAAVVNLFPGTQCGIGPATDDGYFYDFVVERPFVPEDLEAIEKKMQEFASRDLRYERRMIPKEEAKAYFAAARRTAQGAAHRRKGRRRRVVLHDCRRLHGLLHGPARPVDRAR